MEPVETAEGNNELSTEGDSGDIAEVEEIEMDTGDEVERTAVDVEGFVQESEEAVAEG